MSQPQPYKRSTLSFNSPRASPFRRPESPSSPSSTIRPSTPTYQPTTPSKLHNASTPTASGTPTFSPRPRELPVSPTKGANLSNSSSESSMGSTSQLQSPFRTSVGSGSGTAAPPPPAPEWKSSPARALPTPHGNMDALSRLPPAQVRELREAFQILDRNSAGAIDKSDVADVLSGLGLDASGSSLAPYFPASTPHPLPLAHFLTSLSTPLASLSPPSELLAALSAFDDDDSGQIDVEELTKALGETGKGLSAREVRDVVEGFTGRRAFAGGKGMGLGKGGPLGGGKGGEVFRYREWVAGLGAVGGGGEVGEVKAGA